MFKNKYGELRSGWAVAVSIAVYFLASNIVNVLLSLLLLATIGQEGIAAGYDVILSLLMLAGIAAATACMPPLFRLLYKRPLAEMGLVRRNWLKELALGGLIGIVSIVLVAAVLVVTGQARISAVTPGTLGSGLFYLAFARYIFVGFGEELLCRGIMMTALKTTRNRWAVLLGPSVLFSLLHILNANVTVLSLVNIFLVGVVFALMLVRWGKLWVPIGYHITWNFFQGNVLGINVSGGSSGPNVLQIESIGADWITGGAFGAEGGIVVTIVMVLSIAALALWKRPPEPGDWTLESGLPLVRGGAPEATTD